LVSPETLIKLMTDGILLAEIQSDPLLRRYDTIIIDEAHERSLNIDFLLGYLANILPQRPDLKLIITSATIDAQRFAAHFGEHMYGGFAGNLAPIIEVSGRTYPVEIRYRPLEKTSYSSSTSDTSNTTNHSPDADELELIEPKDQVSGIIDAVSELCAEGPGDILVFLSGEGEIRETSAALQDELGARFVPPGGVSKVPGAIEVLPLFARLSAGEQHRIFTRSVYRRVILATNIAETSLTVPGIRYVIDPGTARISRFSNKTKVQRLPIEAISQASANQRSGRCGRVADGIAIRLYDEADFLARPEFTEPEIQRTSLAAVILQMAALGLGDLSSFPFIDKPDLRAIRSGEQLLIEIGAIEEHRNGYALTPIGKKLARLPIDPRLGRMLLAAVELNCSAEMLVLVAAMSVQDVRERPIEAKTQSDQLHARFTDPTSDFLAYLHIWRYLRTQQRELSGSAFRRLCKAEYLHWLRFREWQDVVEQLRQFARNLGVDTRPLPLPNQNDLRDAATEANPGIANHDVITAVKNLSGNDGGTNTDPDAIHQALLVGLLSNLGNWDERKRDYAGARGTHFVIWPGSGLYRRTPAWVMAAELVETSRLFARTVARIQPEWIEKSATHLVKKQYSEPFWSTRQGAAMVHEKITLYGMTLVADRPVLLSRVGTTEAKNLARELFIRHALVENQWRTHHKFVKHNQQELAIAAESEARLRQYGLVADDEARFSFFAARIPENIVSARHFDSWWKKNRSKHPELLNFTQEFLLGKNTANEDDFPTTWVQGEFELPISYNFQPGRHSDGLTIDVPVTVLPQLADVNFEWLVPGMLPELVLSTIRALPKRIRRHLVPAPDVSAEILQLLTHPLSGLTPAAQQITGEQLSFRQAFSKAVMQLRNIEITAADWEECTLPEHLQITFQVRSERNAILDVDTSLTALQQRLAPVTQNAVEQVMKSAVAQALESVRGELLKNAAAEQEQQRLAENAEKSRQAAAQQAQALANNLGAHSEQLESWPELATAELPLLVEQTEANGMTVRGYPAFVAELPEASPTQASTADTQTKLMPQVQLRVLTDSALALAEHRQGVLWLLTKDLALPTGRITSRWNGTESLVLSASPYPSTEALVIDLQYAAARNIATKWAKREKVKLGMIRSETQFSELKSYTLQLLEDETYRIARIVVRIFSQYSELENALRLAKSTALINTVEDIRHQLSQLIYPGFIGKTPDTFLADLPRFIQAAQYRLEKAALNPDKDFENTELVSELTAELHAERESFTLMPFDQARDNTLTEVRWLLEELRVSLFAQQLGTRVKVSPQRIEKLLGN
ncbi:MAG: DUF3418 domain-containing protein, partial [Arcanobacterium sp.]|nr:DUF3418 domain-containing protein [Arcanobacterium sp.]